MTETFKQNLIEQLSSAKQGAATFTDRRCSNCRFALMSGTMANPHDSQLFCLRYPPHTMYTPLGLISTNPKVSDDWTCGEFKRVKNDV